MARVEALEGWQDKADERLRLVEKHVPSPDEKRDIEHRIRALEARERKYAGAIAVIVFVCALVGTIVAKKLEG